MDERLAQPEQLMLERNIAHLAKRFREVEIWVEGIPEPRIGFIAGLDEDFIQVCRSDNATLANIGRDKIISVEETGRNLTGLSWEDGTTADEIRQKVSHFQKRAVHVLRKEAS